MEDVHSLRVLAEQAERRGDLDLALKHLIRGAEQVHASERDYAALLVQLRDFFLRQGQPRGAMAVLFYLFGSDPSAFDAAERIKSEVSVEDRARLLVARATGRSSKGRSKEVSREDARLLVEAARVLEEGGRLVQAAIHLETARAFGDARALWSRLASGVANTRQQDRYQAALVFFNLARMARECGDARGAHEAFVSSVGLLEEAADHFEGQGQRERAFDCFQVLVEVGRFGSSFENVLEGYVNCIRILKEDHLKQFALQHFDEALEEARRQSEFAAGATLAREASQYAKSLGQTDEASLYLADEGDLWCSVYEQHVTRGDPPEIAENALLAAILAYGEVGRFRSVGTLYERLATLELDAGRKAHYLRASARYAGTADAPRGASKRTRRGLDSTTDVWHVDLVEWEERGSAVDAASDVLLDRRWPEVVRRRALLARLAGHAVEHLAPNAEEKLRNEALLTLAGRLGDLQLYAALAPLERLYEEGSPELKVSVLQAMGSLFFKRTFATVRRAAHDLDPRVQQAAAKTVSALYFPHAYDPLSRLLRETTHRSIRDGAIRALARVDTIEAAEMMLGLLDHGAPDDRAASIDGLKAAHGTRFIEVARAALPSLGKDAATAVRSVLAHRHVTA